MISPGTKKVNLTRENNLRAAGRLCGSTEIIFVSGSLLFISEAVAAVDGTVGAGLKGNFAFLSAFGANCVIHLACAVVGGVFALCAALFAALGLVGEAFLGIKLLLTGSESEFLSAFLADQGLVCVHEIPLSVITRSLDWLASTIIQRKTHFVNRKC